MRAKNGNDPGRRDGVEAARVAVTVEGLWRRRLMVTAIALVIGALVFLVGNEAVDRLGGDGGRGVGSGRDQDDPVPVGSATTDPGEGAEQPSSAEIDRGGSDPDVEPIADRSSDDGAPSTLRFVAFDEPFVLLDADTDPALNNSAGIDLAVLAGPGVADGEVDPATDVEIEAAAVVADLVATGPAGATVAVHPGDRPGDGLQVTIPSAGRILIPHLIAMADDQGRIVVSASEQVRVRLNGLGSLVPSRETRAGRFVTTDSLRIGSLVPATDGRELTITLGDVLGPEADHVGQAVIRLNANVGPTGGSVTIGSGPEIPWPAPASQDVGLAGTELLTVTPDPDGQILIDYVGGSALTADLVGYYTNDVAPASTTGLLVLSERPELQIIEIGADDRSFRLDNAPLAGGGTVADGLGGAVVVVEASNGGSGGTVTFADENEPLPSSPAFALAPEQRRVTTEWFDPATGVSPAVEAPRGATLRVWTLGGYT